MYPLEGTADFPRQQWYVAALSSEVTRELLPRRILGAPVVFYRTEAGEPVALAGLCPHRFFPLGRGCLHGDELECAYHGLRFDSTGRCVRVPSQDEVPTGLRVRSFPLRERAGWIWIWMGQADKAARGAMPDVTAIGVGAPGFRHDLSAPLHLPARYQLLIDNLMDLTHISFVHSRTVPDGGHVATCPAEVTQDEGVLRVWRRFPQGPTEGFSKMLHPDLDGPVDSSLVSEYFGPCLINAGGPYVTPVGSTHTRKMNFIHAITPETATTTHYFNGVSRNFSLDNDGLSAALLAQSTAVIREDIESLAELEPYAEEFGDPRKEWSMQADAGAIRVRRLLSAQIRAERAEDTVP